MQDNDLSKRDLLLLDRIRKTKVPIWRQSIGLLLIGIGVSLMALVIIDGFLGLLGEQFQAVIVAMVVATLGGVIHLQEFRYQKIIFYLLSDHDNSRLVE